MEAQGETSEDLVNSIGCHLKIFRITRIYGLSGFFQGFKFFSFLKKNSIHTIITYHFASDIWGTFWGHLAGVPLIISNRRDMGFWRNTLHILAYRLINPWVNKIITVTESIKQMVIQKEEVSERKIQVIYNGVELPASVDSLITQKDSLGLTPTDKIVLHTANLRPIKGHVYLIEAFAQVLKQYPQTKLVLVGKDELNGKIQNLAERLKIKDKVLFLGQRNDVQSLIPLADICVLPSLSEGMSNAILEYMACGKPVIATKVGGNPELIIDGFNGLLVDKENTTQIANALLSLLQDPQKSKIMGKNGLALIKKNFAMEVMINEYQKILQPKVLHLVSSGGFYGTEQMILTLANLKDGIIQIVGALNNKHNPHLEIVEEAQTRNIKTVIFDSQGRFDINTANQITRFIKDNQIDIIHTHNYKANVLGAWAALKTQKRWIVTVHGWVGSDAKLRWYEQLDRFILRFANKIICVSDTNYQNLADKGVAIEKMLVIANGIDLNKFSRKQPNEGLKESLKIPSKCTVIVIVGRLSPEKGHEVLFKALANILNQTSAFKCLVVGEGDLKNELEMRAKNLGLTNHVIFTGVRKDMSDIYNISDILVNASYSEGLPMTILEAMAAKVAIIATSVGAVSNVIEHSKSGIVLQPGNSQELSSSVYSLIKDPNLRDQLTQEAYQRIQTSFSDLQMFQQYKNVYNTIK